MTRVVERALSIMETFDAARPALPLQEIALRSGLPKPTAFRFLAQLVESGYVVQLANQDYCLSHRVMRLAAVAQRTFSIRDFARPVMMELLSTTGETVDLSVLNGTNRVCVDVIDSPQPLKSIISPGDTVALGAGATGKVLLAFNEAELIDKVCAIQPALAKEELAAKLAEVRERGYALSRGERIEGVEAISVPLFDHTRSVRYCLTLTGPSFRFQTREDDFISTLLEAGRTISKQLGAPD